MNRIYGVPCYNGSGATAVDGVLLLAEVASTTKKE